MFLTDGVPQLRALPNKACLIPFCLFHYVIRCTPRPWGCSSACEYDCTQSRLLGEVIELLIFGGLGNIRYAPPDRRIRLFLFLFSCVSHDGISFCLYVVGSVCDRCIGQSIVMTERGRQSIVCYRSW